jgi:hypothetical protein
MGMGPTQPPIQWVPGTLSLGVKRPGCEAHHSPPSSAEVKEYVELYLHSPNTPSLRDAQLKYKHRDNFTLTLSLFLLILSSNLRLLSPSNGLLPTAFRIKMYALVIYLMSTIIHTHLIVL